MFNNITQKEFLQNYWQKQPYLFKNVFSQKDFKGFPDANELAGLSLDGVSARIITGNHSNKDWSIINQPFADDVFATLPKNNWTLLVQGVDRFIQEVNEFVHNFNFIPRWKFDDALMSYAPIGGSVGPHFDYYDVFLVQVLGKRRWKLSSKSCNENNYNPNFELKIMDTFESEIDVIAEVGDVLYVPPKYAHFGESISNDCITASFGYRSYHSSELADFVERKPLQEEYYSDPIWSQEYPAYISNLAIQNANTLVKMSSEEFAEFITTTQLIDEEILQYQHYQEFDLNKIYTLHPSIKIAYLDNKNVFIAGQKFEYDKDQTKTILDFANSRKISATSSIAKQLFDLGYLY